MEKVDVAIQSYKKPESLIYTLFSLKKYCGNYVDTVYINDDCSGNNILEYYQKEELQKRMFPIKIKIRKNIKPSGYSYTLLTKEMWKKKNVQDKLKLIGHLFLNRLKIVSTSDDIRYQWAINSTDKKYIFLIHDDIKFFDDVLKLYIENMEKDNNIAIVGDLGGSRRCPYGPCGQKCSPEKIMNNIYPSKDYPLTGKEASFFHKILGRKRRNCRINEWCCLIRVGVANELSDKYGIYFGNYEGGGDVGTYWFEKVIKLQYKFIDPLPNFEERKKYYLHWWQGYMGHSVWEDAGNGIATYEKEIIINKLKEEFDYFFLGIERKR